MIELGSGASVGQVRQPSHIVEPVVIGSVINPVTRADISGGCGIGISPLDIDHAISKVPNHAAPEIAEANA